jgi:MFS family permease
MRERTRVLVVASVVLYLAGLVWYNYSALLPRVAADWGLSDAESGIVFAAFQLGYALAILPVGALADRGPVRWLVAAGSVATGLATLGFAVVADGFVLGALFRLAAGVAMAGVYVPGMRFLGDWYPPERRGRVFGIYVGAFSLSSGSSYFLASAVAAEFGWRLAIGATSVGAVVGGPLVAALTREHPDATDAGGGFDRSLLTDRSYLAAVGVYTGHNWELFGARNWIQAFLLSTPALAATGSATVVAGTITGVAVALGSVANAASGVLSDHFGRLRTLAAILAVSALLSGTLGFLRGLSLAVLTAIVLVYGLAVLRSNSGGRIT